MSAEVDGLAADPSQPAQNLNPLQGADPDAGFSPEREQQIKELAERPDIYDALVRALAPSIWCARAGGNLPDDNARFRTRAARLLRPQLVLPSLTPLASVCASFLSSLFEGSWRT